MRFQTGDRALCQVNRPGSWVPVKVKELSERAVEVLTAAGWSPDRRVDTSELEIELVREEFTPSPAALEFLARFDRIAVRHKTGNEFHFDPRVCFDFIGDQLLNDYGPRLGVDLCPLGQCAGGYMVLGMAPDGRVFAGFDGQLKKVADSGLEAVVVLGADAPLQSVEGE